MNIDIFSLLYGIGHSVSKFFADSFLIAALKFFLFVYVVVVLLDIVMLLMLRGLSVDLKNTLFGTSRPLVSRSGVIKRWEKILARLASENPSQHKVAVLEADVFADEILGRIGYKGTTMGEKLEAIHPGQLETRSLLVDAHQLRNRVVHEA